MRRRAGGTGVGRQPTDGTPAIPLTIDPLSGAVHADGVIRAMRGAAGTAAACGWDASRRTERQRSPGSGQDQSMSMSMSMSMCPCPPRMGSHPCDEGCGRDRDGVRMGGQPTDGTPAPGPCGWVSAAASGGVRRGAVGAAGWDGKTC